MLNTPIDLSKFTSTIRPSARYRLLIVFVTAFAAAIIGLLSLNIYMSTTFNLSAQEINLAGRQRVLTERLAKNLLRVKLAQHIDSSANDALDELATAFELFDDTLTAFDKGGKTFNLENKLTHYSPVTNALARQAIAETQSLWQSYRDALKSLLISNRELSVAWSKVSRTAVRVNEEQVDAMDGLSRALTDDTSAVRRSPLLYKNIVNGQRGLSERLMTLILELSGEKERNVYGVQSDMDKIQKSMELFDTTMVALKDGGVTYNAVGKPITILPMQGQQTQHILSVATQSWGELKGELQRLLQVHDQADARLDIAVQLELDRNGRILELMNKLTVALENDFYRRSAILQNVQIAGIILALLMFIGIVFHFVRQLKRSDAQAVQSQEETTHILGTVNDGLFLLDEKLSIARMHSTSLLNILRCEQLAGENLMAVLAKIVPTTTLTVAEDYLKLMFGERVNEKLVADLNPLGSVEVHFADENGDYEIAHLSFSFKRVQLSDNKVTHLLVQVDDVSDKVRLSRELESSRERADVQLDLLVNVLHVEPAMLRHFLSSTEVALESINQLLQTRMVSDNEASVRLEQIFRIMHTVKGDAAGLDLELFVKKAHEFEDKLSALRERDDLSGNDFIQLALKLDDFMRQIDLFRKLTEKIGALQKMSSHSPSGDPASRRSQVGLLDDVQLMTMASRIAKDQGKSVVFSLNGEEYLPDAYHPILNQILCQLIGNSIVHGIEDPVARTESEKPASGSIRATISENNHGHIEIRYRDDGRGLDPEKLREVAVTKGMYTQNAANELSREQCLALAFKPGITTARKLDSHAGRGVGMDIVSSAIIDLGGEVSVSSESGEYCEFILVLPPIDEHASDDMESISQSN